MNLVDEFKNAANSAASKHGLTCDFKVLVNSDAFVASFHNADAHANAAISGLEIKIFDEPLRIFKGRINQAIQLLG